MVELLGKPREELREFCAGLGEPAYRGAQIYHALYAERKLNFAQMTNLPASLRERLTKDAAITSPEIKQRFRSSDGSVRYLFALKPVTDKPEAGLASVGRWTFSPSVATIPAMAFALIFSCVIGVTLARRRFTNPRGVRRGLPLLPHGAAGTDAQFNCRRNHCAGPHSSRRA